ncbi:DUF4249 domain-containing protein [Flagellimonas ochracea]|nr:DUF4249 domain-containing protein [Allomuricauda ochracea]
MRIRNITYRFLFPAVIMVSLCSCIEPFEATFVDFESILVVDATITNEMKQQQIILTRTYEFEAEGPTGESGATVRVVSDNGASYDFMESDDGNYYSEEPFASQSDTQYTLSITTRDGSSYQSEQAQMGNVSNIDSLYAERIVNDFGDEGMGIFLNTSSLDETENFYRWEYEETYKVIAPRWNPKELELDESTDPQNIIIVPRSLDERVCYPFRKSTNFLLADTEDFNQGSIENFMVRFINRNNYIISHRYSILVRQFGQSQQAQNFYETLNSFATSESLFSETQPGFLEGNVFPVQDGADQILGYFNVVTVDEERIFFNYEDFFPGERLPPYVSPCLETAPENGLRDLVRLDLIKYIEENEGIIIPGGPYIIVPQVCGDCTILGPSEIPDFWIE